MRTVAERVASMLHGVPPGEYTHCLFCGRPTRHNYYCAEYDFAYYGDAVCSNKRTSQEKAVICGKP